MDAEQQAALERAIHTLTSLNEWPLAVRIRDVQRKHGSAQSPLRHKCRVPNGGLPGDDWSCPICEAKWWADDIDSVEGAYIEWRRDV